MKQQKYAGIIATKNFYLSIFSTIVLIVLLFVSRDNNKIKQGYHFARVSIRNSTIGNQTGTQHIHFTIKTTKAFLKDRVELLSNTWFKRAKNVFVITDRSDPLFSTDAGYQLIATKCGSTHSLPDLCCKTGASFNTVANSPNLRWWCHVDDDDYINIERLIEHLTKFDWKTPVYIGRKSVRSFTSRYKGKTITYQFGTGGAGACMSKPLVEKMRPWAGGDEFVKTCKEVYAADDVTIGFIVTHLLKIPLNESFLFHSHMEQLKDLPANTLNKQVCLSYKGENLINLNNTMGKFSIADDPTRILSLHCLIYPTDTLCKPPF